MLLTSAKYLVSDSEEMITVRVKSNFDFKGKITCCGLDTRSITYSWNIKSYSLLYYQTKYNG